MAVWTDHLPSAAADFLESFRSETARRIPPGLSARWQVATRRYQMALIAVAAVGASVGMARLIYLYELLPVAATAIVAALLVLLRNPRWGLYLVFGLILYFEQVPADALMMPGDVLNASLASRFGLPGLIFTPLEMLLIAAALVWLIQGIAAGTLDFRRGTLIRRILFFGGLLLAGILRGVVSG